jgi:hypothetical protein
VDVTGGFPAGRAADWRITSMKGKTVNGDTVALLKECDSGCKMATDSMEQIGQFVNNPELSEVIERYNRDHIALGEEIHELLTEIGETEQEPGMMAKAFARISSQIKMMVKGDTHEAASILTDGCNMGIKSLNEYRNRYTEAEGEITRICDRLIKLEKEFMGDLEQFL